MIKINIMFHRPSPEIMISIRNHSKKITQITDHNSVIRIDENSDFNTFLYSLSFIKCAFLCNSVFAILANKVFQIEPARKTDDNLYIFYQNQDYCRD